MKARMTRKTRKTPWRGETEHERRKGYAGERVGLSREDLSEVLEYLNAEKTSDSLREEDFADKIVVGWTKLL